jgi:RNA polymerase sigma-70 factor (ECF subfamily)
VSPPRTKHEVPSDGERPIEGRQESSTDEFRALFEEHAGFVWRALRYLGVREADLPDQVQEVFVVVHRRLSDFEGRSKVSTWLYGICMRVASEHRRRAHVRREIPTDEMPDEAFAATQEHSVETNQRRERLNQLLDALDEMQRRVFVLYEIEGVSMKDIAELLECPLATAYSRLRLAREALMAGLSTAQEAAS